MPRPEQEAVGQIDITLGRIRLAIQQGNQERCHAIIDDHFREWKPERVDDGNVEIADIGLPVRVVNALEGVGILWTNDLKAWPPAELFRSAFSLGEGGIKQIKHALAHHGIKIERWRL